ncbi:MAG: carbohydrate kinase, partial [Clostridia bacterium]|nr:carbohydrate kinase [Clostridia bacterium]
MKIAGLDIGTTGCKITVFDENGAKTGSEYRAYPASRLKSTHELDAFALRDSILEVVTAAAVRFPDIKGIGVTSFGESFIAAGSDGNPLRPLMLYTDPRGAEECAELVNKLGREKIASITGLNPHSMYSLPKLMWIARNEPEVFAKIKHVFLVEDYAVFLLTGKRAIDYSLATRTMAFDLKTLKWSGEIFG